MANIEKLIHFQQVLRSYKSAGSELRSGTWSVAGAPLPVMTQPSVIYVPTYPSYSSVTQVVNVVTTEEPRPEKKTREDKIEEEEKEDNTAANVATGLALGAGVITATGFLASAYCRNRDLKRNLERAYEQVAPYLSCKSGDLYQEWRAAAFPPMGNTVSKIGIALGGFSSIVLGARLGNGLAIYSGIAALTALTSWQTWNWITDDQEELLNNLLTSVEAEISKHIPATY